MYISENLNINQHIQMIHSCSGTYFYTLYHFSYNDQDNMMRWLSLSHTIGGHPADPSQISGQFQSPGSAPAVWHPSVQLRPEKGAISRGGIKYCLSLPLLKRNIMLILNTFCIWNLKCKNLKYKYKIQGGRSNNGHISVIEWLPGSNTNAESRNTKIQNIKKKNINTSWGNR